jgi:iron complex outermembrane receptor protein
MPRTTGPVMRVLDVERIEVLRGPQGTLFGRNSTGGAIRVFSRQASSEQDGYVRLTMGNFDHQDVQAMINVPITEQLFFRAQAASLEEDGYVRRGPQMLGGNDDTIARVQLTWEPSDTLSLRFGAMHSDSKSEGSPTDMIFFNMDPVCPEELGGGEFYCLQGNYADWVSDFLEQSGQDRLRQNDARLVADDYAMPDWCFLDDADPDWDDMCRQWNNSKYTQVDANIEWRISDRVTMLSTTGLSDFKSSGVSDWQLLGMEFRPSGVESEVFYQEFQFNFSIGDRVDFVAGLSYFNEDSGSPREALYNAIGSSTFNAMTGGSANGNLWGCNDSLGVPCAGPERRLRVTGDGETWQESTAIGLFANATIHFGDRVNLTLGVRESNDEKEFRNTAYASDNFIPEVGDSTTISAKDDWSATDYRATVDFSITDDFMLYVTSSRAFRSGTFSVPNAVCNNAGPVCTTFHRRPPPALVPPETLLNHELGFRSEWLDGRLRVNATYFEMDYTDRQGASAVVDATAPTGFRIDLVNQGDVDLWGSEVEAMFAVTDRLTIEGATGRTNYRMGDPCINNGPFLFPPPMDREHSLTGRYDWPRASGNLRFTLNYTKTGPMQTHPGGFTPDELARYGCSAFSATFIDSRYEVPSYNLANLSVRYSPNDARWSTTFFVNNLTDEVYANNAQSFGRGYWTQGGPAGGSGYSAPARQAIADYRGRPREYGLTFQYSFY